MTEGKRTVTQRAAMARLRRRLKAENQNNAAGYDRRQEGYYIVDGGQLIERGSYSDFEEWCRKWGALATYEALEQ